MNQIAQQGKDMLEIVEKYEVPQEYHNALWAAYEAGAHMGFFKALESKTKATTAASERPNTTTQADKNASKEEK